MADQIKIEITGREAKLILKYGYPFPEQVEMFENISTAREYHTILIDRYWLELIIGDLSRSMREIRSNRLLEELDCLCTSLETSLRGSNTFVVDFDD